MRKLIAFITIGLAGLSIASASATSAESDQGSGGFDAHLLPRNEVPPLTGTMTGRAVFDVVDGGQAVHYTLTLNDTSQVFVAHIHLAPAGFNGPIVVFLFGPLPLPGLTQEDVRVEGYITKASLVGPLAGKTLNDLLSAMKSGQAYVNAHTVAHPGGAARGQIEVVVNDEGPDS